MTVLSTSLYRHGGAKQRISSSATGVGSLADTSHSVGTGRRAVAKYVGWIVTVKLSPLNHSLR
jgi:hypothetical protein